MQIVTGNRLGDGVVAYFAGGGAWSPAIDDALIAEEGEEETLLAAARTGSAPQPAIGPTLVEVTREDGRLVPVSLRERIRAFGPTTGPMRGHTALHRG